MNKNLVIIAGSGDLPYLTLQASAQSYERVLAIVSSGEAHRDIKRHHTPPNATICRIPLTKMADMLATIGAYTPADIICIGKYHKLDLLAQIPHLDSTARQYLGRLSSYNDNAFHQLVETIATEQRLTPISQKTYLREYFVGADIYHQGIMTDNIEADIAYGQDIAQKASQLGISQTIVVKDLSVMAYEAAEGTNETIVRGCKYAHRHACIIKVPWTDQLETFDLPTIGPQTMKIIAKHKGSALCIKANETFVIDMPTCLEIARKHNIHFMAF